MTKSGFSGLTSLSEIQSLDTEPPIGYFHILSTPANHLLPLVLLITKMSKTILPAAYGEGNGNPLQYSCLENPMDGGAWQATDHGIARVRHDLATKPPPPPPRCLSQKSNNHHWFCSFAHSVPNIPYIQFISQSHWFDIQNISQTKPWFR